jgi:hypothetical protein
MNRRLAPVVAVIVSVAGCGGHSAPTSPTTPSSVVSPAGSWSGSISDPISGDGTARLSLGAQAPNSLTGDVVGDVQERRQLLGSSGG